MFCRTRVLKINIHSVHVDLVGDLITLFCWKLSRRSPTETYPYGFGKFEVLGTAAVSVLLTGGAIGLGLHSLSLLVESLSHTAATLPPGALQDILVNVTNVVHNVPLSDLQCHEPRSPIALVIDIAASMQRGEHEV